MSTGVHWVEPEPGPVPGPDVEGDAHPRVVGRVVGRVGRIAGRVGRRTRIGAAGVVGTAVVVAAAALTGTDDADRAGPTPGPTAPRTVSSESLDRSTLARVAALATRTRAATDLVRQTSAAGSCPSVRPGSTPAIAIAGAVHAVLPRFALRTDRRILDQFTGLCSIEFRSGAVDGTVLVVSVAAPSGAEHPAADRISRGAVTSGATTTRYVLADLRTGWSVLVGSRGPGAALPTSRELADVVTLSAAVAAPSR